MMRIEPIPFIVGILLVVAALPSANAQEVSKRTASQPQVRIWTDRTGAHHTEASLVECSGGQVSLKKKDGTTIQVPLESLSDADQTYVQNAEKKVGPNVKATGETAGRSETTVAHGALPQAKEVVVTGVGTDPEKALQNAFSQAIEQTVGLLVDAETVVKNDELIRDEVLTFSKGYMENFEVVKRWQEDGLHHATIRATVARDKLVAKLKGMKIAVVDTPGELASRQFEFDAKNEEQAAEMFKKALAGFNMTELTKVEIIGKPEIKRESSSASVRIKVQLSPDKQRWNDIAKDLRQVLTKTSTKRASVVIEGGEAEAALIFIGKGAHGSSSMAREAGERLRQQLRGEGVLVALFKTANIDGRRMEWDLFRVPQSLEGAIRVTLPPAYGVTCVLLDESGGEIARLTQNVRGWSWNAGRSVMDFAPFWRRVYSPKWSQNDSPVLEKGWWIGPVWGSWGTDVSMSPVLVMKMTISSISQEDLARLAKTVAFLEKVAAKR